MAEKNGVEVPYFEVKHLLWQDCLAAPCVSVQIITGLPTWTKAERSGPEAVGLCIFHRSALVTNTCVVGSCPLEKWLYIYCGCVCSVYVTALRRVHFCPRCPSIRQNWKP
jgi:hypothetical protein